ncbi:MAG TPA: ExeM/NucH family extracellular endonuclease [Acidimicrobiales bacterium]|nr:ExeM/NucH family extracellular endonuclease [Acidimicrobiales bacterium]
MLATPPRPAGAAPTELFISEYVEGTSNNKAIEIFNGTGALVDLAADVYDLQYFFNGNPVAGLTINLTGSVADGDAYVVAQASANASILAQADQTNSSNWFNGDDAVVLRRAGVVIDSIGQAGVDPGTEWGAGLTSTADNTVRRKAAIEAGDPTPTDAFDPALEWDGFATATFDGLGAHGADTAPDVTTTSPADGAGDVAPGASVTITFSEPVVVTGDWFTISCATSGAHPATVTGGPTTFVLQPDAPFTTSEACTVTVAAAAVSDQDTNDPPDTMAADVVFGFSTGDPCAGPSTPLSQVQGSGATSPVAGTVVTVQGVVVGDHQGSGALQGFFVQEEDADADADPATSEGLFVFQGSSGADVAAGDVVRVTGTITEFTSSGTQLTELASVTSVAVCGAGASVTPTTLSFPVAAIDDLERFEGMLVQNAGTLTVTETFTLGRFGEVSLSAGGRLANPTAVVEPGPPAIALQDLNNRSRIILDDANTQQNRDPIRYPEPAGLSASNTLRIGDTVAPQTFVLDQRFGAYRLQPVGPVTFSADNPRPASPPDVGGDVQVAAFNVLNYFNGDGAGGGFPTARGASTPAELDRQRDKIVAAITALDADVVGLMELENDTGPNSAIDELVAGLNAATAPGTYAFIDTGIVGTDEIRVGLLYQPAQVTPVGAFAVLDSSVDPRFIDTKNRPTLAQTFTTVADGAGFTVAVNHLKSKGSDCNDVGDPDTGDGSGNCNGTRTQAAAALVDWLATDPTGSGDPDVLIIGDLNAYAMETPIDTLVGGGYTNLIQQALGADAYSFVFQGQSGYLDHALGSPSLTGQVTGAAEWHTNADEPVVLDYNTEFKSAGQIASLFAPTPFRASDHDPLIVGLALDSGGPTVDAGGPYTVVEGGSMTLTATGTDPEGGTLSFAWDLDGDGMFESPGASVTFAAGADQAPATRTVTVRVTDQSGATAVDTTTVNVVWAFTGFLAPIKNPPDVNTTIAGVPIAIRFRLGGFQGADPAASTPTVQRKDCATGAPIGTATDASFVGPAPLFIPGVRTYAYTWRTERSWRGSCATFTLALDDGTVHRAEFRFT